MTNHKDFHPDFLARSKEILGWAHQALSHGDTVSAASAIKQHRALFDGCGDPPAEHVRVRVKLALACLAFENSLLETDPSVHL